MIELGDKKMKIRHYTHKDSFSRNEHYSLMYLIQEGVFDCESIDKMCDEIYGKSILCCFDDENDACAFASLEEGDSCLYLNKLYVSYLSRKKGIGRALINVTKKIAKTKGYDYVMLSVAMCNNRARKIYENAGFVYDYFDNQIACGMKLNINKKERLTGAFLYELNKKYGQENLLNGIEEVSKNQNYSMFFKYFNAENKVELVEKYFDKDLLKETVELIASIQNPQDERFVQRILKYKDSCFLTSQEREKFEKTLEKDNCLQISLSADSFLDYKKHELLSKQIKQKVGEGKII